MLHLKSQGSHPKSQRVRTELRLRVRNKWRGEDQSSEGRLRRLRWQWRCLSLPYALQHLLQAGRVQQFSDLLEVSCNNNCIGGHTDSRCRQRVVTDSNFVFVTCSWSQTNSELRTSVHNSETLPCCVVLKWAPDPHVVCCVQKCIQLTSDEEDEGE